MTKVFTMECGCKFPISDEEKVDLLDGIPSIEVDYENLNLNCPKTYELLASGKTLGVFQLEQSLGQGWSKRLEPSNLDEVAALTAILRPGCLKSKLDGKSMTQHFIDRKHMREECVSIHEVIDDVTKLTYHIIVYQEQSMKIVQIVALFTLQQADKLRKAMGKKDAALMAKTRIEFLECAKKAGIVSEDKAIEIFDIIEKSNRYSFNASHSYSYGKVTLWSAYMKAHFPNVFFDAFLSNADNKADSKEEIADLVNDARYFGFSFETPDIFKLNENFTIKGKVITFGIGNVSKVGDKKVEEVKHSIVAAQMELNKQFHNFTWFEILTQLSTRINSEVFQNLISVGAFRQIPMYRRQMLFEFNKFKTLTEREVNFIKSKATDLHGAINLLLNQTDIKITSNRIEKLKSVQKTLENPPNELKDDEDWIANVEKNLLGIEITCSKLDKCNAGIGNCKCAEFDKFDIPQYNIVASVAKISEYRPKEGSLKGKCMAYITINDETGSCECVAFPATYKEFEHLLFEGNTLYIIGTKSKSGSLQIKKVNQI